jgi:hypothetical protein
MFDFSKIFGRHEVDVWRDQHTLDAATILNDLAAHLACGFEKELEGATWKDRLVSPRSFIATRVAPAVRAAAEAVVVKIVDRANRDLQEIVAYQAVWSDIPHDVAVRDDSTAAIRDVAVAAGPLAGGAAVAVALPAMSVTTTTAFFGLVTTSVISWPVVAVGATVIGASLATGLLNGKRIQAKAEDRLRKNIHDYVVASLLKGQRGQPAILEQLTALFAQTAAEAKRL